MGNNRKIIEFSELPLIKESHKNEQVVLCDGSFDLLHEGHISFIKSAKSLGDVLVVGVCRDSEVSRRKGRGRPVLKEKTRLEKISALAPVDYAFLKKDFDGDNWMKVVKEMFETLSPDIYATSSNISELETIMNEVKELDIEGKVFERHPKEKFNHLSTTKIIEALKRTSS